MAPDVTCALCGLEFDPTDATCAHGCPLASVCNLLECPNCHYEFPRLADAERRPSRLGERLRRWLGKRATKPARCPERARTVLDMSPGEDASVLCFSDGRESRHNALAVFGLVPGAEIRLLQQRSSPVVQVGETALALDRAIAASIVVTHAGPASAERARARDRAASSAGRDSRRRVLPQRGQAAS